MTNSGLMPAHVGTAVTVGSGLAAWFAQNMPVFEGVSLIISIVAGVLTSVYTSMKIIEWLVKKVRK